MRIAALLSDTFIHHLDHMAAACFYLDAPLFVDCKDVYAAAKKYYPMIRVEPMPTNLKEVAKHFDLFILSTKHARKELSLSFSALGFPNKRFCYLPHGHSDKGLTNENMLSIVDQDIALLYGKLQKERVERHSPHTNIVEVGNLRHHLYLAHQEFYDCYIRSLKNEHFTKDQPTAIYAPTWNDTEHGSSFIDFTKDLLLHFPSTMNLWIKPHPFLERDHPAHYYHLEGVLQERPNIHLLADFPLTYPTLASTSLYIGDYSAINYDQLYFPMPAFFIAHSETPIHKSGKRIASSKEIFGEPHIEKNKEPFRKRSYAEVDPSQIKQALIKACEKAK